MDVLGYRRWAFFFREIGMNAFIAYMTPDLIPFTSIRTVLRRRLRSPLVPLYYLFRNRTFIRI
jgi:hypothetical protein